MGLTTEGGGDLAGAAADGAPGDEGHEGSPPVPTISVVVASRNRRHLLRPFVEAIAADPAAAELLVVLDGDVDGSHAYLEELAREFPIVRPILTEHRGHLGALELGVGQSGSDVVLLMDDDVIAGPGLVSGHARHHAGTNDLVVMGYMPVQLHDGASPATRLYAREYLAHCDRLEAGDPAVLDGLWLGNVSVRRSELVRIGIASKTFAAFWHSDLDLGLRLRAGGLHGVFDRRLRAAHMHSRTAEAFLRDARERGRSAWLLEREHGERYDATRTVPMLDTLGPPTRQAVSFLGRDKRAEWSSKLLMNVGGRVERLGWTDLSTRSAQLARRIQIVSGFRHASSEEPARAAAPGR